MIRTTALVASALALFAATLAAPASAQSPSSQSPSGQAASSASASRDAWSFLLGVGTENRSKNISKSGGDASVFGSAIWESADGLFYAGPGFETVQAGGSNIEAEFVVGYQPEAFGYRFDFNAAYKHRVGAQAGYDEIGVELTGNVSRSIGPANARLQVQYSPDAPGSTDSFTWVEGRVGWDFTNRLEGTAAIGRREQNGAPDYIGWNAGVTYALTDALDVDVRYYDTDAHTFGEQYEDALVAQVAYAF